MNSSDWTKWLEENHAQDIAETPLGDVSDITDYVILATARNTRHLKHLAEDAMMLAKENGEGLLAADGLDNSEWVVLDFGIYMLHLMLPATREIYALETFWEHLRQKRTDETTTP